MFITVGSALNCPSSLGYAQFRTQRFRVSTPGKIECYCPGWKEISSDPAPGDLNVFNIMRKADASDNSRSKMGMFV